MSASARSKSQPRIPVAAVTCRLDGMTIMGSANAMAPAPTRSSSASGPNGLAAAIVARAGRAARSSSSRPSRRVGGGVRSAALTLPGFVHDVCSAVHPLAVASPFFRTLPLAAHGLEWIEPPVDARASARRRHGGAVVTGRSSATADGLRSTTAAAYRRLIGSVVRAWPQTRAVRARPAARGRAHPFALARFGLHALQSAARLARARFARRGARALFAGIAAHGMLPLDRRADRRRRRWCSARWRTPPDGCFRAAARSALPTRSPRICDRSAARSSPAHASRRSTICRRRARSCAICRRVRCCAIAGHRFPRAYRRSLERYRYGMGVFKVDWALDGPIPWRAEACARAGHGARRRHARGDRARRSATRGTAASHERPFVLLAQPTLFDRDARAGRTPHRVGVLPRAARIDRRHAAARSSGRSSASRRASATASSRVSVMRPADLERTTRTSSAATSVRA